jgi:hypothetical protein
LAVKERKFSISVLKKIKKIALGIYEILKQLVYYNIKDVSLILQSSWNFFYSLKNEKFLEKI